MRTWKAFIYILQNSMPTRYEDPLVLQLILSLCYQMRLFQLLSLLCRQGILTTKYGLLGHTCFFLFCNQLLECVFLESFYMWPSFWQLKQGTTGFCRFHTCSDFLIATIIFTWQFITSSIFTSQADYREWLMSYCWIDSFEMEHVKNDFVYYLC